VTDTNATEAKPWHNVDDDARTEGLIDRDALGKWMDERGLPGKREPVETTYLSGGSCLKAATRRCCGSTACSRR